MILGSSHHRLIKTIFTKKLQICWWDSRKGGNPEGIVPMDQCHIDPVYKTIWINAKAGTEFFTASTDGMVSYIVFKISTFPFVETERWN